MHFFYFLHSIALFSQQAHTIAILWSLMPVTTSFNLQSKVVGLFATPSRTLPSKTVSSPLSYSIGGLPWNVVCNKNFTNTHGKISSHFRSKLFDYSKQSLFTKGRMAPPAHTFGHALNCPFASLDLRSRNANPKIFVYACPTFAKILLSISIFIPAWRRGERTTLFRPSAYKYSIKTLRMVQIPPSRPKR